MVSIPRPGVEVVQEIRNATPNFFDPTLPALVMAPAYEVIELFANSALNPDAKYTDENGESYDNFRSLTFYQTEFPGGHVTESTGGLTNTKAGQVNVLEEEVRAFLDYGAVQELAEHDTSDDSRVLKGFLVAHNVANRPFVRGSVDISSGGLAISGSFLQVAIDVIGGSYPHYLPNDSEGKDTVITFSTGSEVGGTLSAQDVVDQINAIIPGLAYLYTTTAGVQNLALVSPNYGANARVIIRDTGASSVLGFHTLGDGDLYALGGGFRARDDGDADFESPYVELYQGLTRSNSATILVGALVDEPTSDLTDPDNYDGTAIPVPAINLVTGSSIRTGDEIIADGVSYGFLYSAQNTLLTLGTGAVAASNSEISRREVNLQTHGSAPWAPRYVYFRARNLTPTAPASSTQATVDSVNVGSSVWNDPAPARVTSGNNPSFPMVFGAGAQFKYTATIDGAPSVERTHILSGTANNLADLVAAMNGGAVVGLDCSPPLSTYGEIHAVAAVSDLQLNTGAAVGSEKTGKNQFISIGNGDANILFDPNSGNVQNIVENEIFQGLDHYSLDRAPGDNSNLWSYRGLLSGVDATLSVAGTKFFTLNAVKDNGESEQFNLKATGDFGGGSTPYTNTVLQGLYNMALALNGVFQSSTSGIIQIDDIDGNTDLQDQRLYLHQGRVKWEFLGPDKYIRLSGTEAVSTFVAGESVSQATTGATGVIIGVSGVAPAITLDIAVDAGSAPFDATNTITGGTSTATLATLTPQPRLALACDQDGASNQVTINTHTGGDPLGDSIGFADGDDVRGVGIRIGSQFLFQIDQNPVFLGVTFQGEPVQWNDLGIENYVFMEQVVDDINTAAQEVIAEVNDAAGAGNSVIRITSAKFGLPSEFKVNPQGSGSGNPGYVEAWVGSAGITASELGLTYDETVAASDQTAGRGALAIGSGRPLPDFAILGSNPTQVFVGSQALRDPVTGVPLRDAVADLYLSYRGLREDISAARASEGFSGLATALDLTELEENYGPISEKNPFGLAMRLALANLTNVPVYGLGIGNVDADNPDGTLTAWSEALEYIESKRVYALAPISQDTRIHDVVAAHVAKMSEPTSRGERIAYINSATPERAVPTFVGSGTDAQNGPTPTTIQLDSSIVAALRSAGVQNLGFIPASEGVYIEVEGSSLRWNISEVAAAGAGTLISIRSSFNAGENDDNFYTTAGVPAGLVAVDWAVYVRGNPIATRSDIATAIAAQASRFGSRRIRHLVASSVIVNLTGTEEEISAAYLTPIYAALASQQNPQQGFTNFRISGLTRVKGTNDTFSETQMDVIAGGGNNIIIQPQTGGDIFSRHQLTTDVSSTETQEDSITRILDYVSYFMRDGLRNIIGTFNISPEFLDQFSTVVQGMLAQLEELGVIVSGVAGNPIVDENDPTAILLQLDLQVPFPVNRIRLTIAI